MTGKMTKGERDDLSRLVRQREKVMKSQARERSALLIAEFETQMAQIYHYDDDATWASAKAEAEKAVAEANEAIAARCRDMGIPEEFAPYIGIGWASRGHAAVSERRAELRRVATKRIAAMEQEAITKIERMGYDAQSQILAQGLDSDVAKNFLNSMPSMDVLMPPIQIGEIQSLIEVKRAERKRLGYGEYRGGYDIN